MALEGTTLLSNNCFKFVDQETKDKCLLGLPWKPADQKSGRITKITSSTHPSSYGFPLSFALGSHIWLKKLFHNYFRVLALGSHFLSCPHVPFSPPHVLPKSQSMSLHVDSRGKLHIGTTSFYLLRIHSLLGKHHSSLTLLL